MKKFNAKFKVGTKVKINGNNDWLIISQLNDVRTHIKIKGFLGSFQRAHIIKFTNK